MIHSVSRYLEMARTCMLRTKGGEPKHGQGWKLQHYHGEAG
jgi:hypothetical protein